MGIWWEAHRDPSETQNEKKKRDDGERKEEPACCAGVRCCGGVIRNGSCRALCLPRWVQNSAWKEHMLYRRGQEVPLGKTIDASTWTSMDLLSCTWWCSSSGPTPTAIRDSVWMHVSRGRVQ